jgi:co-chaperonin GroES (HSP10)
MQPLHDRLLIKPYEEEAVSEGAGSGNRVSKAAGSIGRAWRHPHPQSATLNLTPTRHPRPPRPSPPQKTAGGILLPSAPPKANSDAHFGEVLAVGEAVKLEVKAGDMIVYNKYAMAEVEVPEGVVVFVAEKSVLGKLE